MAKVHPDMYRVYRDFYPHSFIDAIYAMPPCLITEWCLEEGQHITTKTHAYSLVVPIRLDSF